MAHHSTTQTSHSDPGSDPLNDPVVLNDWHVVARASDLGPGGIKAARLLGRDLVLWRNDDGIHAWLDLCRHRGAKLSLGKVIDECLVCPYHGWCYDSSGVCTRIPAHPKLAPAMRVKAGVFLAEEHYGLIWVCLGAPAQGVPSYPEWDDPKYHKILAGPYLFRACATRVMENFLDIGHYPFVHARYFGASKNVEIADYEVEVSGAGPVAKEIGVWRIWKTGPDGTGDSVEVKYTYRAQRPFAGNYTKFHGAEHFSMLDAVTPVDEGESLVWSVMAANYPTGQTDREILEYQDKVSTEDVPIVESQRPRLLPLNPGAELSVPSDSMSVAYRRWLARLGLKFGTL